MEFEITWDYRCPFARNANEHVIEALRDGAEWNVGFVPFSLDQVHVEDGEQNVWDDPASASGLLSLMAGTVVRDRFPDRFLDTHLALFSARHDHARDLRDRAVVEAVLDESGVDAAAVLDEIDTGRALKRVQSDHERVAFDHDVWGVPTIIVGERAMFVRLMSRPDGDRTRARATIERVLDLIVGFDDLNELKQTRVER